MAPARFNDEDIKRWVASEAFIPLIMDRFRHDPNHKANLQGQAYGTLREASWGHAQTCVALKQWRRALGWLVVRCEAYITKMQAFNAGKITHFGCHAAGHWQTLLHSHATRRPEIVNQVCILFDLDKAAHPMAGSTKGSMYIARILKALTEKRFTDAKATLLENRPEVERMFSGFLECMDAIANEDEALFRRELSKAAEAWEKYAARFWKGLPDAVCFLNGVAILRLAEFIWQRPCKVAIANIPAELLDEIEPETIDLGSPTFR